jgi:hypothetical protein
MSTEEYIDYLMDQGYAKEDAVEVAISETVNVHGEKV